MITSNIKEIALFVLLAVWSGEAMGQPRGNLHPSPRIRIALNFYSFNTPLSHGSKTIESVIDYASDVGFDGVDITGYYLPNYPAIPSDDYILEIKAHAFRQGITICGTGVRNDFTLADPLALEKEKQLVRDWTVVASKLGASTLRIYSGAKIPDGEMREETEHRVAAAVNECAAFAKSHGIMLALQNHDDFLKTAEDVDRLFALIDSDNVGLMLDIGSCHTDPYREIEQTVQYAISWQIKENVFIDNVETKTDIPRVMDIVARHGYRGFVPIEILGSGNEHQRAHEMFEQVNGARETTKQKK
jgi:sugar phosphate isomerase/epimerase